jgi:hypothetical protein
MIHRRQILRASGALLALPAIAGTAEGSAPPRLIAIHVPLGRIPEISFA